MPPTDLKFLYAGIRVRNVAKSLRFYRALGLRILKRGVMEHGGVWIHLEDPRTHQRLELNYYPRSNRFYEPFRAGTELDHLGFRVDDVDRWVERARRAGGTVVADVRETHERLAFVRDPNGVWVEFIGEPAPPPKK